MINTVVSILWSQWTLIFSVALFAAYKWLTEFYGHFEKQNIPYEKPELFFGNFKGLILRNECLFETLKNMYLKYKDQKFFGLFEIRNPVLVINDREIIKQIAIKDFDSFLNHRFILDSYSDPLFGNCLLALKDQKWKDMRATLSPAFTGSKMRLMFQLVDECGTKARENLKAKALKGGNIEIDLKEFFTRFTYDVIASCAFGIKIDSLTETDNEFYHMSRKATISGFSAVKLFLVGNFTKIMRVLKVRVVDKTFSDYLYRLVLDTMQQRFENGIVRPDMIQLLMEARKGALNANDLGKADTADGFAAVQESTVGQKRVSRQWTDVDLAAQCFVFFVAGFETSSVLMCFCAHELMENPDVQERLIEEIDQVREDLGDKPITYDVIQKMKYLDMVICETLRKWPPGIGVDRVCNKATKIEGNNGNLVQLNPGDIIHFPVVGLHHDPDLFPEPERFDPERFSDENKHKIQPFSYLPFGIGPRNCIGSRFALMESKAIIYHLLSQFTFEASPKTCRPLKLGKSGIRQTPEGGFWLNFKRRQ